jgi:Predicted metal-dependent membrane protease
VDLPSLALLGLTLGVLVWRAVMRERREYARFKRLRTPKARQDVYRRWVREGFLTLGGLSAATIVGAWERHASLLEESQRWAPIATARDVLGGPWGPALTTGTVLAALVLLVLPLVAFRGQVDEVPAVGDIRALLPRTRGELPYGAALSLNAGVFEELLFRLGLPGLLFAVTGHAAVAFAVATVLFGLLHLYQGPLGVLFSGILGAVFVALYLVTGSIVVPIVVHAAIDARSLVLIPVILGNAARVK